MDKEDVKYTYIQTHIMEFYWAIKNKIVSFVKTWMDSVDTMLCELNQIAKDLYCMFLFIWEAWKFLREKLEP